MDTWCSRQFTWNVIPYLVSIKRQQQTLKVWSALLSVRNVWYYCKHNLSTQTHERIYRIHDMFICCRIKLCTKLHNAEPMTHQKHLFSEHWHITYTVTFPFTQGNPCFPNIWIQSGSTTWLCGELLTIVVLNRFVHCRVPTAVILRILHGCEGGIEKLIP